MDGENVLWFCVVILAVIAFSGVFGALAIVAIAGYVSAAESTNYE